jgi:hypothetical protein
MFTLCAGMFHPCSNPIYCVLGLLEGATELHKYGTGFSVRSRLVADSSLKLVSSVGGSPHGGWRLSGKR